MKYLFDIRTACAGAVMLSFLLAAPAPAFAQCENAGSATQSMNKLARNLTDLLKDWLTQEKDFADKKIYTTSRDEVSTRLEELDGNLARGISQWWRDYFNPALKEMTQQLHYAKIDQTMRIGMMMDAQMMNETIAVIQKHQAEARRNFQPSESTCQVDNVATSQTQAQEVSSGLVQAWAGEGQIRGMNTVMKDPYATDKNGFIKKAYAADPNEPDIMNAAAAGSAAEQRELWKEYVKYFCDPARGDQGCKTAGSLPGQNTDIAEMLWGNRQTIDLSNKDNRRVVDAVQRYMILPSVMDPIPAPIIDSKSGKSTPQGIEQMLRRRAHIARLNTVYNVVGNMLAERVSTTKVNLQSIRVPAGAEPGDVSTEASYREIQDAMTRDRFQDPEFMARMVADPKQLIREQSSINGMRMQQMSDIYKRTEEALFMETALAAGDLDKRIPK